MFKRNKASTRDPLSQQLVAVEGVIEEAAAATSRRANDSAPPPVPTAATEEELASAPPRPALTKPAPAPPPPQSRASIVSVNPNFASSAASSSSSDANKGGSVAHPPLAPVDPPPKRNKKFQVQLKALFPFTAQHEDELSLKGKGYRMVGYELMEDNKWWYGEDPKTKQRGLFPASYVRAVDAEVRDELETLLGPTVPAAGAAAAPAKKDGDASKLKLTLYAHNLGYACAFFCMLMGLFSCLWWAERNKGNVSELRYQSLFTDIVIWIYSIALSPALFYFEYQYGMTRARSPKPHISRRGFMFFVAGIPLLAGFPTMFCTALLWTNGIVNAMADYYREEGDASHVKGSYFVVWFDSGNDTKEEKRIKKRKQDEEELTWVEKAREKGVLVQNLIVIAYFAINAVLMADAAVKWYIAVDLAIQTCVVEQCPTRYAIVAKTFGQMLNFNCAVLLLPVLKSGLRWMSNYNLKNGTSLASYIPVRKNIIFHRLVASFIAVGVFGHVTAHMVNFAFAAEFTLNAFGPAAWVTGFLCLFAMVMIYTGAQNRVKRSSYEIFWYSHHFFVLFFFALLAHGPDFWAWCLVPVLMYVVDRVYRLFVGNQPFYLRRVLYIPPVMQLSFFPSSGNSFTFREGQYLYLLCSHLSVGEWHPFTISSAAGDLEGDQKEVTVHIRVQGLKSWTRRLMNYFSLMTHSSMRKADGSFLLELYHYNSMGIIEPGKYLGADGVPLISIDGPHSAPAQQYVFYQEVMLVGAGIGLTPSSSILKAICRHKWKKGFIPNVIYFYWVVRQDELESFRWFANVLVELEKRVASDRHAGALSPQHYLEINIYVTNAPKPGGAVVQPKKMEISHDMTRDQLVGYAVDVGFTEESLMRNLLNPKARSDKQREIQGGEAPAPDGTRLVDIWIWNGRPKWDDIFLSVKQQRDPNTSKIGCCFCGTPIIGKDLKRHCQEKSSFKDNFRFDLHKENF